jgi:hypothetical protein
MGATRDGILLGRHRQCRLYFGIETSRRTAGEAAAHAPMNRAKKSRHALAA